MIPTARATHFTMNRDRIRDLAAQQLVSAPARYAYASCFEELQAAATAIGYPNVIKPVMSSSGRPVDRPATRSTRLGVCDRGFSWR
ncbi:hypothetical protein [Synechococcus elongatus]|uniref:hypothetical protein n=1 Tax=Synechococcus elongatus TaxID=32046 RepID=UPI003CC82FB1